MEPVLIIVVAVALFFNFTNGFHDTANAIATIVSTKALSPKAAVIGASLLNLAGAFISLNVAATIASDIVNPTAVTLPTILAGLVGAIIWNLLTWRTGTPSSSSHTLVGGMAGAAAMSAGWHVIEWHELGSKVLIPSVISPFVGLAAAFVLMIVVARIAQRYPKNKSSRTFRHLQLLSGGFVALMHGTNDAQKTMGIIALALAVASGNNHFGVPLWVIVSSAAAMAAGTWMGGWRIIQTVGEKITKLEPPQGFAAQTVTAVTLGVTSHFGLPVSTTHTISGSIIGTGMATKSSTVNWHVIRHIVLAWIITIPCAAIMGAGADLITRLPHGSGILLLITIVIASAIYLTRNWTWEARAQIKVLLTLLQRGRK